MTGEVSGFGKIDDHGLANRIQGGYEKLVGTARQGAPAGEVKPETKPETRQEQNRAQPDRLALSGEMREAQLGGDFARLKTVLSDIFKKLEGRGADKADEKRQAGIDAKESGPLAAFVPFAREGREVGQGELLGVLPGVEQLEDSNTGRLLKLDGDGAVRSPAEGTINYAHGGGDVMSGQVIFSETSRDSKVHTSYFLP
jgi:hypothetical protein